MWIIDMFITDNEAISVENALQQIGFDVRIKRQIMWEIKIEKDSKDTLEKIKKSGTLFNPNKEFIKKQTGAFLHRFSWIKDTDIGELDKEWNWLALEYEEKKYINDSTISKYFYKIDGANLIETENQNEQ